MARPPGQKDDAYAGGAASAAGRMLGFVAAAGLAFALLAAAVLLPAWHRLDVARADRAALTAQVDMYERYIDYKGRLIEAIKTDPVQTERLLMAQRNYRRPGEQRVAIDDAPVDPPPLAALAAGQPSPREPSPLLARLSLRVQQPRIRRGVLLLSGIMGLLAVFLFLPTDHEPHPMRHDRPQSARA